MAGGMPCDPPPPQWNKVPWIKRGWKTLHGRLWCAWIDKSESFSLCYIKFMCIHTGQIRSQNCSQNCICPWLLHTHKAHEARTKVQVVRYCFSNIHIFHDVHQYNKTLIDLHYNYFMYFRFFHSVYFPLHLSQPLFSITKKQQNKSIQQSKGRETQIKTGTLLVIPWSCPSFKTRPTKAIWVCLPETHGLNTNQKPFLKKNPT